MRSHNIRIAAIAVFTILSSQFVIAQKTAGEYLETIGIEFNQIQSETWKYTSSVAHGKSARKVEKNRKDVIFATTAAIRKINSMKPFEGNSELRDSALSYLRINHAVLSEDYAKLMDMEEISEQSYDNMEAYMLAREKANDRLHLAGEMIDVQYRKFAKNNNINLIDDNSKLSKNMAVANKVYDHYNVIYLIFFKSYKQEAYVLTAMEKNDVNGIEQNKNALVKTSTEGLEKLKGLTAYENDQSLIKACKQMLEFYKEEAEKKLSIVSAFYVAKDNFEKIKTGFDAKAASKRTQADVDQFNQAVNDYNKASQEYNKVNAELNKSRSSFLNDWNNACEKFTDKHVPKG